MRTELISKKKIDRRESPIKEESNVMIVDLYRIKKGTIIPKEALNPEIWDIPEGYYALEHKEDLD